MLRVCILFGGRSAEHEVSLQSAMNVISALDKKKYEVVLMAIDKRGRWHWQDPQSFLLNSNDPKLVRLNQKGVESVQIRPGIELPVGKKIDVVFPVLHGPFGEDGTVQGLLKLAGIPFVGASVLGSAIGMDKDVMKRLLKQAGLPVVNFQTFHRGQAPKFEEITETLGLPLFVKPANLGSSVGISRVRKREDFDPAITLAFSFDNKIVIEAGVKGREIEIAVLGNENPIASIAGEIIPKDGFYSYEAKYIDENGAALEVPAKNLSKKVLSQMQSMALEAFRVLECEGMARVDFFLLNEDQIIINEINTLPGFTKISMYPRLWEASGLSYSGLIDKLIELALQRHARDAKLVLDVSQA